MPMLPNANWFGWHAAGPASNPVLPSKGVLYATTAASALPMDTTCKSIPSSRTINLSKNASFVFSDITI